MSELGAGQGSSYPVSLDTDTTTEINQPSASKTKLRAACFNDLNAAILAVERTLGTTPQGTKTDVKTFLQTEHGTDGKHGTITVGGIAITATPTANAPALFDSGARMNTNAPAFLAQKTASQSIPDNVLTKIQFETEVYDTANNYDNATNYRFTPTVAGKYLITANMAYNEGNSIYGVSDATIHLFKNGGGYAHSHIECDSALTNLTASMCPLCVIVDANGSTDFFEIYGLINVGDPFTAGYQGSVAGGVTATYFSAVRIGI
jgi:hypothetical protein